MLTIQHPGLELAVMGVESLAGVVELDATTPPMVMELDSPTPSMVRGVELWASPTSPTLCSVATQTDKLWPESVWGECEGATTSPVPGNERSRARRKKRKTRRNSAASPTRIYSGAFFRSKRLSNSYSRMDCSSRVAGELRSGMVHELPLPFAGPTVDGIEPFTSYPLALELVRLGIERWELEGGGEEKAEVQLDDSGLCSLNTQ